MADRLALASTRRVRRSYRLLAVCGLLLLAVVVVFGQTAGHGFVFDDVEYVLENSHVQRGLTGEGTIWAMGAYYASNWHPLTWLSHMLDCQLYQLQPCGHHLSNVVLHAAAAVFLFLALRRMTAAVWPSAWAAAVFAIHPLRAESVAWVAERKDVLSGLFFMVTLWFYARYAERPASWGRYLLVLASFALGLTAKPMLVTLPLVLLLLDYWPLGRHEDRANPPRRSGNLVSLVVEKIPFFVLAAATCVVTLAAQRHAIDASEQVAFTARAANIAAAYVAYLGKMLYPAGLAALYPLAKTPRPTWEVVAAVSVLLAISAAVFAARRKCPYLLFGWLWYLATLAPVIGLVQVGSQAMADRYTYLTQIGLYVALAWGGAQVAGVWPHWRWAFAAGSAVVLAGLIVCAWQQTRHWRDNETLWSHALACNSENAVAEYCLGNALGRRGEVDAAIAHYRSALTINPDYVDVLNNLGSILAGRGEFAEAITDFREIVRIKPDYVLAYHNLGLALANHGEVDEAITYYLKALEIRPDYLDAHLSLGNALVSCGRLDEAFDHYQKALRLASTRNERARTDALRARIRLRQSAIPAGKAP